MRTYDLKKILKATSQYRGGNFEGFYPEEWIKNNKNVALLNDRDDIALFEDHSDLYEDGVVAGHYFFFSRGREAIRTAKEFLEEIFNGGYGIHTIVGLTPVDHKAALWMNNKLGFKNHGVIDTVIGPCRFVMLTKEQWKESK